MRVLVTGGSGFIGRAVVDELREQGHEPKVFDLARRQNICSRPDVDIAVSKVDAVIHLAGVLGTSELFVMPHHAVDVNVKGALNVLQACAVYGARYVGITMPRVWNNVYQATKVCAQTLALAWSENSGVPVSHVCAYNAYGPGQKRRGVQKIVPTFAHAAWRGEPIPVWGDGNQQVDLISHTQVAAVLVQALAYGKGEVFDAGTGQGRTVNDVVSMVGEIVGRQLDVQYSEMRAGETPADVVAQGRGWAEIGRPVFDESMFEAAVRYYKEERP